jgi:zinc/manganese transport system substrate-binding protein
MRTRLLVVPALAAAAAIALAGCSSSSGSSASAADGTVQVVASTNVYGSLVEAIGGKHVDVTSILSDPNQDPHTFEASAKTQLAVSKAQLLIENGGGYDTFMDTLRSSSKSSAPLINVVNLSGLKKAGDTDFNEHVFYSYPTMVTLVAKIEAQLAKIDSADASTFSANAKTLTTKLQKLESETTALKAKYSGEHVMFTEPVPGYLFEAIGLENVTPPKFSEAVEEGDDVAPAALNETLNLVATGTQVKLLAYNLQASSAETEQVKKAANASGVAVIGVTETLPTGDDYISWQQANIDHVQAALAK